MENNFEIHEIQGDVKIPFNVKLSGQKLGYFENKMKEIIEKEIKENNLHYPTFRIINKEFFETAIVSMDETIVYKITYKARKRNEDDDLRESIECMIENLK